MQARLLIGEGSNMRYATGLDLPDTIYAELAKRYLLVPRAHLGDAIAQAREGVIVQAIEDVSLEHLRIIHRKPTIADAAAAFLLAANATETLVAENLWFSHAEILREHGLRVRIDTPFFPQRLIKSPDEIARIREAGKATMAAMEGVRLLLARATIEWNDTLVDGKELTSARIREHIVHTLIERGCTLVELGPLDLKAGEPIVVDITAKKQGYCCRLARTMIKGTPRPELIDALDTIASRFEEASSVLAPGSIQQLTLAAKCEGHGIGLDPREPPRIVETSQESMTSGMCVVVVIEEDGCLRADTFVVTAKGAKCLTNSPAIVVVK